MKFIKRILWMPFSLFKGLFKLANNHARDIENKYLFPKAIIDEGSTFTPDTTIGKHTHILSGAIINHSHIGKYSYCNRNVLIQNTTIGNYCSISNDVIIGLGSHPLDLFSTTTLFYKANNTLKINLVKEDYNFEEFQPIKIGNDVWVGAKAVIMDGVNVGDGAVVAAGAVVVKDVPPYAIVGGVPAKIIRYRFKEEIRVKLLETNWWEKDAEEVYKLKQELATICK